MKYLKGNKKSQALMGNNNGMWKDRPSLSAIHIWVSKRKIKPPFCEDCKNVPPVDLANISQKYLRDTNDFEWLCRKCHMIKDGRLEKLSNLNKEKAFLPIRKCLCCAKSFKTKSISHTTCSLSCSVRHRMAKQNNRALIPLRLECVSCKSVFRPKRVRQLCCSKKCSSAYVNYKRWGFVSCG